MYVQIEEHSQLQPLRTHQSDRDGYAIGLLYVLRRHNAIIMAVAFFPIRVSERGYAINEMWREIKRNRMTSRTSP